MSQPELRKQAGIHTIALTGGPSAGKTTLMNRIREQLPAAICAPEVATVLLSGGFPPPPEGTRLGWQESFQKAVATGQLALEEILLAQAKNESRKIVIFDRGMIDGAAYLLNNYKGAHAYNLKRFEAMSGESTADSLNRYDTVLHLSSSAAHGAYDKQSNLHRFEEADEALKLEEKTLHVWAEHSNRTIISDAEKAARVQRGMDIIMGIATQ